MVRRAPLLLLSLVLGALASCGSEPRRPNVVLVAVDTLRSDRLGCYGYERPTSPFLDQLASEGTLFEDATAQAGWTLPSMVSMFTGRYLTAYREKMPDDIPSIAELYRAAGYRTVAVVANLGVNASGGFDRGFDVYDLEAEPPRPGDTGARPRTIDTLTEGLWRVLDDEPADSDRPLFLFLFPYDPHDPYYPHEALAETLPPAETEPVQPPNWHRQVLEHHPAPAPDVDPDWSKHLAQIQKQRGLYDQEVRFTDDGLRAIFDGLRERGILEGAVVAVTSDHGEGLWEHRSLKKQEELDRATPIELFYKAHGQHLYEEAVATPLILWGAGVPRGLRVPHPVENTDLLPTLLELSGLPIPSTAHGVSLVPQFEPGAAPPHATIHSFLYHQVSLRDAASGLKILLPTDARIKRVEPPRELFHLPSDPHERRNLWEPRKADAARLEALVRNWEARFPDEEGWTIEEDPEQLELMRALGYTEDELNRGGTEPDSSTDADPDSVGGK